MCAHELSLFLCEGVQWGRSVPHGCLRDIYGWKMRVLVFTVEGSLDQARPLAGRLPGPFAPWTSRPSWLLAKLKASPGCRAVRTWPGLPWPRLGVPLEPLVPWSTHPLCCLPKHQPAGPSALVFSH